MILSIWTPHFKIAELTEVMRQKNDATFAHMLNRLRVHEANQTIAAEDLAMLNSRNNLPNVPDDALHVFACNKPADEHNASKLTALALATKRPIVTNVALDYMKDGHSNMRKLANPVSSNNNALLPELKLCAGSPVMLMRNIDVNDGLANGAFGKAEGFRLGTRDDSIKAVYTKFDDKAVGKKASIIEGTHAGCVQIEIHEENMIGKNSNVIRRQIPLRLSWASTIHKTQGKTVNQIVVSCNQIRNHGQAYVAFSRAKTLDGLYIHGFKNAVIHCDPHIKAALLQLKRLTDECSRLDMVCTTGESSFTILHQNVEGLLNNYADVTKFFEGHPSDMLMLTETWLNMQVSTSSILWKGYTMYRNDRLSDHIDRNRGGVAICVKENFNSKVIDLKVPHIEHIAIEVSMQDYKFVCVAVYRSPHSKLKGFCLHLQKLIETALLCQNTSAIICGGDFNEDLLSNARHTIADLFKQYDFEQHITEATTSKHTLLDHFYVRQHKKIEVESEVIQTYYSYHEATRIRLV